ncbi:dicarboxylate/amino acid:cation symporter [Phenylobacterium sp.]|uniref:dicarboxylate/amino acid:cation symporter n=1 Tax=Phenylobacterium sp. TaxID=1871053 RepID=UPI002B7CA65C|nr:cation:dicarboxylase symporter family transporter [Phenylobacterium sp.]HLZ76051.1 cation:dicarboxylase symporter family transporter [Phenylobacterium sp.]
MLRSLSVRVLIALILGLALGAAAAAFAGPGVKQAIGIVESVGGLWLNALRMTVVPLIFAVLVVGIAGVADAAATGRLAVKTIVLIVAALTFSSIYTVLFAEGFYALWPVSSAGAAALRVGASAAPDLARQAPNLIDFIKGLAPPNAVKAAAEDSILPLVVFASFFGFAVTRLAEARRKAMLEFFDSVSEAMVTIVRWVLLAAPVGVFALGLGVGLRAGIGAAGEIGHYVAAISLTNISLTVVAALAAMLVGRVPLGVWTRAVAPVQVAAFATQSSLACLPAMIERSRDDLGIPDRVSGLVLPLAVALFRFTGPAANLGVALFVARVYGFHPTFAEYVGVVAVAVATSLASVSLPGQLSFFASIAPLCLTLGLPVDLLPILIAVEVIPDIFRTIGNVTADMAITKMLANSEAAGAETATA